jgi:hypothetical protein
MTIYPQALPPGSLIWDKTLDPTFLWGADVGGGDPSATYTMIAAGARVMFFLTQAGAIVNPPGLKQIGPGPSTDFAIPLLWGPGQRGWIQ